MSPMRGSGRASGPMRWAVSVALAVLLAGAAWGARTARVQEVPRPSYAIPNIAAIVMALTVLAIACKRFQRV